MANLYRVFKDLIPVNPLLVGIVTAVNTGACTVDLPTGGSVVARGVAVVGNTVFVRDGVIEGVAPSLTIETIEV